MLKQTSRTPVVAFCAVLMLAATGCGSGGSTASSSASSTSALSTSASSSSTPVTPTSTTAAAAPSTATTTGLTHAQFVAKLDQLCQAANVKAAVADAAFQKAAAAGDYAKAADIVQQEITANQPYIVKAQQLTAPAEDSAAFASFVQSIQQLQGSLEKIAGALRAHNLQEVVQLAKVGQQERDARTKAATELGTTHCAR
jgi:hypothetical protein